MQICDEIYHKSNTQLDLGPRRDITSRLQYHV